MYEKSHIILQLIHVISYRSKTKESKQISQRDQSFGLFFIIFIVLTRRIKKMNTAMSKDLY
jgi:hypothetical protein